MAAPSFKRRRAESPAPRASPDPEPVDDDAVAAAVLANVASDGVAQAARPVKRPRTDAANRSLFVRALPADTDSDKLAVFFSEHFPVKHATVVVDPVTKVSRGYGFVTLSDAQDVLKAKETLDNTPWGGKRLRVDIAEPRKRDGKGKDAAAAGAEKLPVVQPRPGLPPKTKTKLIVRNLPWSIKTSEQLGALFRSYGVILSADLPQSKGKMAGFGFVTIRGRPNAERALENMNGKQVDGRTVSVDWAMDKDQWTKGREPTGEGKKGTQVVAEEEDDDENDDDYEEEEEDEDMEDGEGEDEDEDDDEEGDDESDDDSDGGVDLEDIEGDGETWEDKTPAKPVDATLEADLAAFMKNHMGNMDDEDEDEDEDEDDEDEDDDEEDDDGDDDDDHSHSHSHSADADARMAPKKLVTDNSTTAFVRNLPFTVTDATLKEHFARFGPVRYARVVMDRATSRPAGTGFVCFFNEADLKTCVRNAPRTQPLGPEGKRSILHDETADTTGDYTLEGRTLRVAAAVSKEEATRITAHGHDGKKDDRRRLFLLNEGAVDTRSSLHALLTPGEVKMRDASTNQRRKLLQNNPSLHLSLTRLAVRNIPRHVTSKTLKELARKAVVGFATEVKEGRRQPLSKEELARDTDEIRDADKQRKAKGKGIVRQCKVVYESRDGVKANDEGVGAKSRGYGFVEYTSHRHALMGLRWLNGHQVEGGDEGAKSKKGGRLIVEFAIENVQVVMRRKAAQERQKQRREGEGGGKEEEEEDTEEAKLLRGKPRVEKRQRGWNESRKKGKGKKGGDDKKAAAGDKGPRGKKGPGAAAGGEKKGEARDKVVDKERAAVQQVVQRKRVMKKKRRAGAA
jgi:nucleolar protein 4